MQVKGGNNQIWINLTTLLLQFSGLLSSTVKLKASSAICYSNYEPRNSICEELRQAVAKKVFWKAGMVTRTKNVLLTEASPRAYTVMLELLVCSRHSLQAQLLNAQVFAAELHRSLCSRWIWAPGSRGWAQRQQQGIRGVAEICHPAWVLISCSTPGWPTDEVASGPRLSWLCETSFVIIQAGFWLCCCWILYWDLAGQQNRGWRTKLGWLLISRCACALW